MWHKTEFSSFVTSAWLLLTGALNQIDWSKSNQVSINVKPKQQPNQTSLQQAPASKQAPASAGDVPINQYRSIVAPVKSGKTAKLSSQSFYLAPFTAFPLHFARVSDISIFSLITEHWIYKLYLLLWHTLVA